MFCTVGAYCIGQFDNEKSLQNGSVSDQSSVENGLLGLNLKLYQFGYYETIYNQPNVYLTEFQRKFEYKTPMKINNKIRFHIKQTKKKTSNISKQLFRNSKTVQMFWELYNV